MHLQCAGLQLPVCASQPRHRRGARTCVPLAQHRHPADVSGAAAPWPWAQGEVLQALLVRATGEEEEEEGLGGDPGTGGGEAGHL